MKSFLPVLLVLSTSALWAGLSHATETVISYISVQGSGAVTTVPDHARLTMTVGNRHSAVTQAKAAVDNQIGQISAMLKKLGIQAQDINNAPLRIYPEYQQDKNATEMFRVEREVNVMIRDLSLYPLVLEQASQLGITQLNPAELLSSDTAKLYQQALELAYADAEFKAKQLAKLSGRKIARVHQIHEQGSSPAPREKMAMMAADTVHFGSSQVRADLSVQFELSKP